MNRRQHKRIDNKINSIIRKGRQLSVLSDQNSSQEARKQALQELHENRQRPSSAYIGDGLYELPNKVDPNRPSIEQDMNRRVTKKHGYDVYPGGYQAFTNAQVTTSPRVLPKPNLSNWDYQDRRAHSPIPQERYPSAMLKQQMTQANLQYTESVIHALKTQADRQRTKIGTVFERFERTNNVPQDQLYCIAEALGIITEKYESTAGKWVVVMPYASPQTLDQVLYNQKGISGKTQQQLQKQQTGTYWRGADAAYADVYSPQVRPAKPVPGPEQTEYYAGIPSLQKPAQSLRNPKRGDDFIRNSRVTSAVQEGTEDPCWDGYKRKKGTKRYAPGSCIPEAEAKSKSCGDGYDYDPETGKCVKRKSTFGMRGGYGYGVLHGHGHHDDKDDESGDGGDGGGMSENYGIGGAKRARSGGIQQRTTSAEAQRVRDAAKPRTPQPGDRDYKVKKPYQPTGTKRNAAGQRMGGMSDEKAAELRRRLRNEEIERLYDLAERTENHGVRGQYLRKIKALKNKQVSEDAAVKNKARREAEYQRGKSSVSAMAESVSRMNHPDYKAIEARREQDAYARHLSLLEQANQMINKGQTGNLLY